jgi:CheY-like chemotaxis protein
MLGMLPRGGSHTVVVVDDDPDLLEALAELLETHGYAVETAANGAEALAKLRGLDAPCLVLLDLMMPVMNGWEFCQRRQADDRLAKVPVVIISADEELAAHAATLSATAFLPKPIDVGRLLDMVGRHC